MPVPETVLQNRYRIIRQLGQGGMGTVFEAVDQRLDTKVALKETLFADERLRKQFEREARLLARLHHPALPRVSDHFSEGDGQFLVMQYIAGEDLAEMIARRQGPFPPDQVLTWADQLLDALDYLHTQDPQIIHRDIKPQNLKLTSRGQVILLDFGLAKGQVSEISRVTTSASIFGYTPNYAPLEQVQGLGTDPRSDIYSLSATLHHLLTGEKPPDALTRAAAIVNGQEDPLKPAHLVNSAVSADIAAVLHKAMAQNREQRYSSAAAMRNALHNGADVATVVNRSEANTVLFPPAARTVPVTTQMNPNQATVGAAANLTAMPGETTVVKPAPKGRSRLYLGLSAAAVVLLIVSGAFFATRDRQSSSGDNVATPASSPADIPNANSPPVNQVVTVASPTPAEEAKKEADKKAESAAVQKEKSEKDKVSTAKDTKKSTKTTAQQEKPEPPDEPEIPEVVVPEIQINPRPRGQRGGFTVRTFPDGSQLITQPDGARILIRPDGTRQILNPPRRRRAPSTP